MITLLSFLSLLTLGTLLARRWITNSTNQKKNPPRFLCFLAHLLVCWFALIIVGNVSTYEARANFDPADFPGDKGITADVVYDGTGNNAITILGGWMISPLCIALAYSLPKKNT